MKENKELPLLYTKYINNELSAEEIRDLLVSLGDFSIEDLNQLTSEILFAEPESTASNEEEDQRLGQILANIKLQQQIPVEKIPVKPIRRKLYTWLSAAAATFLIVGSVLYLSQNDSLEKQAAMANIYPGKNKAVLTLANGSHITLDGAKNGDLAKQGAVQIVKTKDGQVVYTITGKTTSAAEENSIETPKGGQYMLILPDHSKVWLNSGSSLKYPASFADSKNRLVKLTGEAYFEIAKDRTHPFIVKTAQQEVEVLGTHFNINSYTDEPATLTTLLEGSIKVSNAANYKIIKPGEQAALSAGSFKIATANPEEALAWKNGYFRFNDEKIESVMRKIARWYDVEVEFRGEPSGEEYNGKISRFKNIAGVLEMLGETNTVHFKIEGRRILVIK